jgi:DNA-binding GntR family transcriptional regulator
VTWSETKRLDRTSPIPLYFQITLQLQQAIDSGALKPGDRLEPELELTDQFGVSRPTIRQAIEHLVNQGLLTRHRGVGTVVVARRVQRSLALTSLYDDLAVAGRNPTTTVLSIETVPAPPDAAAALAVPISTLILWLERLRSADGVPFALMQNYLPADVFGASFQQTDFEKQGLYQLLRGQGVRFSFGKASDLCSEGDVEGGALVGGRARGCGDRCETDKL